MDYEMTNILNSIAEMCAFSDYNDELSLLINRYDDPELSEDDLSLVSAACAPRPFSELLKSKNEKMIR